MADGPGPDSLNKFDTTINVVKAISWFDLSQYAVAAYILMS